MSCRGDGSEEGAAEEEGEVVEVEEDEASLENEENARESNDAAFEPTRRVQQRGPPPKLEFDDGSRIMTAKQAEPCNMVSTDEGSSKDAIAGETNLEELESRYEIVGMCQLIFTRFCKTKNKKENEEEVVELESLRVALQFPDELLHHAADVCCLFETNLMKHDHHEHTCPPLVFVLGDTTHGSSCCVDHASAEHLNAHVIVHYGHACLSDHHHTHHAPNTPFILYGLKSQHHQPNNTFSPHQCAQQIQQHMQTINAKNILMLYDFAHYAHIPKISKALSDNINVVFGTLPVPIIHHDQTNQNKNDDQNSRVFVFTSDPTLNTTSTQTTTTPTVMLGGLCIPPLSPSSPSSMFQISHYVVLYLGSPNNRQYTDIVLHCSTTTTDTTADTDGSTYKITGTPLAQCLYDPTTATFLTSPNKPSSWYNRHLGKRFYLTQKARSARVFGIVVIPNFSSSTNNIHSNSTLLQQAVATIQNKLHTHHKSFYTIAVGKNVTVQKLANFAEIQCFVLVTGCPYHPVYDAGSHSTTTTEGFHVPMISPYELDVALGVRQWGEDPYGRSLVEFLENSLADGEAVVDGDKDGDEPYYSVISGRYESSTSAATALVTAAEETNEKEGQTESTSTKQGPQEQIMVYQSEAAEFWKQREYQGLQSQVGATPVKAATSGLSGIASDYGK